MKSFLLLLITLCSFTSFSQEHFYDFFVFGKDFGVEQAQYYNAGKYLLMQGKHPDYGNELWVSDGTFSGTGLLKDISSDPNAIYRDFVTMGRYTFFNVYNKSGREMWYTDGTTSGTRKYNQSTYRNGTQISTFNGSLFYTYIVDNKNYEVRRVDSTFSKDTLVGKYARNYDNYQSYFAVSDSFIYFNYDVNIYRVGKSMGAPDLFYQKSTTPGGDLIGLRCYKNALIWYMRNYSSQRTEFYTSTEKKGTTKLMFDTYGWEYIKDYCGLGNILFFTVANDIYKIELSTMIHSRISVSATPFYVAGNGDIEVYNNKVYFQGRNLSYFRTEIWSTNGTTAGTSMVSILASDTIASVNNLKVANGILFFNAFTKKTGRELWSTKGTAATTGIVKEILPGIRSSFKGDFPSVESFNNSLYFNAFKDSVGTEPFLTDGTSGGTKLFMDINNTFNYGDQEVGHFMVAGDYLYLSANDSLSGAELWRTDGSQKGTLMVQNISPDFLPTEFSESVEYKNKLFLTAFSLVEGDELYTSNGKTGSTNSYYVTPSDFLNGSSPRDYVVKEPYLYYVGGQGLLSGTTLYKSDGTKAGTVVLNKGVTGSYTNVSGLRKVGEMLYFSAELSGKGTEPFVSDGTLANTRLLKDINTAANSSNPSYFCGNDSTVFFSALDASGNFGLFKTNGKEAGTNKIFNFSQYNFQNSKPDTILYFDGKVLLKLRYTGSKFPQTTMLAVYDLLKDSLLILQPKKGETYSNPQKMTVIGNKIIFNAAGVQSNYEPWVTDGTADGTYLLKDIMTGNIPSNPSNFTTYNELVIFSAKDAAHGVEAWVSDGTINGTRLLWDIETGTTSSNPTSFVGYKGYIYVAANQGVRTQSLFRIQADSCNAKNLRLRTTSDFMTICNNNNATLFVESGFDNQNIQWYRNDTLLSFSNDTITTRISGLYFVAFNDGSCSKTSNKLKISFGSAIVASIKYVSDTAFCEGTWLYMKQENPNYKTVWIRDNIVVTEGSTCSTYVSGDIYALCSDGFGCTVASNHLKPIRYPKLTPIISKRNDTLLSSISGNTYRWLLNSTTISNATEISYKPTKSGNYQVEVTSKEGCKWMSATYKYTSASAPSINNILINIYPNPVHDILNIELAGIKSLRVVDVLGSTCVQQTGDLNTLDVSALSHGVYTLIIETNTQLLLVKFVK